MRVFALVLSLMAAPAAAHEFWIEPLAYQVSPNGKLEADIVNGEEFSGTKFAYLPQRFVNFMMFLGDERERVGGRPGDLPAMQVEPMGEGLHIAGYQSNWQTLAYEEWEKFQRFVDHKDFGDVRAVHEARGIPLTGFREVYSRHAKTLIAVGNGAGEDQRVGLEIEIVALKNPYTDDLSDGLPVQVHYRNDLRADVQVEVFEKAPNGQVAVSLYRTDANGIAVIPVRSGHRYLLDSVLLREPNVELAFETNSVWETLWASLTFAVPE